VAIFTLLTLQRPGSLRLQLGLPVYTGPRQPPQELPCISCGSRPHVASRPSVRASRGGFRGVNTVQLQAKNALHHNDAEKTKCVYNVRRGFHWLVYFNEPSRTSIVARTECGLAVSFGCDHSETRDTSGRVECTTTSDLSRADVTGDLHLDLTTPI
jgi:hypothetical protein